MKKTIIFSFMSFLGIVGLLKIGVNAAEYIAYQGGEENVDNYRTVVETKDPDPNDPNAPIFESSAVDGGWWRRGKDGAWLISEYQHYTKQGHASCENGAHEFNEGDWADPYNWSKSKVRHTISGNKVYYNYR